jgi:hypothetical protein
MADFAEIAQVCAGVVPVNLATGANDGDWVSLARYHRCTVVLFKGAGADGEDPTLTIEQATTNTGTGAKALPFTRIHVKQGADLFAIGQYTLVTQAAAATYTQSDAGQAQAIWMVDFKSTELDVDGGFTHIRARVADVGNTSQIGGILYLLREPRDAMATLPSAL